MKVLVSSLLALPLTLAAPGAHAPRVPSVSSSVLHRPHLQQLQQQQQQQGGILSLSLRKTVGPPAMTASAARRLHRLRRERAQTADDVDPRALRASPPLPPHQGLIDRSEYYLADLGIGTPPQNVSLLVDTGGWVTWVNPDCARALRLAECNALPAYNPSASNPPPRKVHGLDQVIMYGDFMGASLEGYADVFTWGGSDAAAGNGSSHTTGGTHVPNQPFAVANLTLGLSTGILGLAPDGAGGFDSAVSNYSVVSTLAAQGLTASRTFSLAYNRVVDMGAHGGTLVFGGVDKNRFTGPLVRTPISPLDDNVDAWRYWAHVTNIAHERPDGTAGVRNATNGFGATYMLDSGTTGIYVERGYFDQVLAELNLTRDPLRAEGFPAVDCSYANASNLGALSFTFAGVPLPVPSSSNTTWTNTTWTNTTTPSTPTNATAPGVTIRVPYASLVHPMMYKDPFIVPSPNACFLALSSGGNAYDDGDTFPILGVEFFKAAYAVFDWDNREMAFAQGTDCGAPDLVPIGKGPHAIPDVKGNCK
ncbi:Peptidase aspartic [Niveomyces insectorum RCEF 264]|uniref:Peptidase aspartic n=1 Tax=Niveomyces insectorum RCEF 264 TaxID=1081102 RepID=A0A167QE09_9HYPO|nr:Peptidase aspartic [Niveomyces insectorum RCEF 264]